MVYIQSTSRVMRRILGMYSTYLYEHRTDIKDRIFKTVDNTICSKYINKVVNQMHYERVMDIPFYPELPFDKKKAYKILKGCYPYIKEHIKEFNKVRMEYITDERVIEIGKLFNSYLRLSRYMNIPFDTDEDIEKRAEAERKFYDEHPDW